MNGRYLSTPFFCEQRNDPVDIRPVISEGAFIRMRHAHFYPATQLDVFSSPSLPPHRKDMKFRSVHTSADQRFDHDKNLCEPLIISVVR